LRKSPKTAQNHRIKSAYVDPADNYDNKLVCPDPTTPPANNKLNMTYRDTPMCPGKVANYNCIAGGINVFQVYLCIICPIQMFLEFIL
jgi:hypothetical protein